MKWYKCLINFVLFLFALISAGVGVFMVCGFHYELFGISADLVYDECVRLQFLDVSVGVALFVATAIEALVLVYFDKVRGKISDNWLLKLAGISFILKAVLFLAASNVMTIYIIQLIQATSYTFLSPTQMYYANNKISPADMVKGQAFITASYTLGCAAGNFAGGQLISALGIRAMLLAGVAMAVAGTAVFFLTVDKKDR